MKNMLNTLKNNKIVVNSSWIIGGKVAQMVISFFVGILTARFLGPSNYGLLNLAIAYASFILPICTLGISNVIVKEFIDNPEEGEILGSSIGIRCITSILSIFILLIAVFLMNPNNKDLQKISFIYSFVLILRSFDLFEYYYQAKLMSKICSIASIIAYIITSIYRIILLILNTSVYWFAFAYVLDMLIYILLLLVIYNKQNGKKLYFKWVLAKKILGKSYHYILSSLMVVIYAQTDKIMIGKMLGEKDVGIYSTAVAICSVWTFVLQAIIDSLRPSIIESFNRDRKAYHKNIILLYSIVIWISIVVSTLFCILAKYIILILYGNKYLNAVSPLRIITWYTCFSYIGVARNIWSVCEEKQKYEKIYALSGAITNIVLNFILIPFWGINGAALASLITQLVTNLVVPYLIKETRENAILVIRGFNIVRLIKEIRKII